MIDMLSTELAKAINEKDINTSYHYLLCIIIQLNKDISNGELYDHNLRRSLFDHNVIKSPLGYKFDDTAYKNIKSVLITAISSIVDENGNPEVIEGTAYDERIVSDLIDIIEYIDIMYKFKVNNQIDLDGNPFIQKSYLEKISTICLYVQNEVKTQTLKTFANISSLGFTGFEPLTTTGIENRADSIHGAALDVIENLSEAIIQSIRYQYRENESSFPERLSISDLSKIEPSLSFDQDFQHYIYNNIQHYMMKDLEEGIRCGIYSLACIRNKSAKREYIYDYTHDDRSLARFFAINRRSLQLERCVPQICFANEVDEVKNTQLKLSIELLSLQTDSCKFILLNDYHPDKNEFKSSVLDARIKKEYTRLFTKPYYLKIKVNGISISDFFMACEYICTLSEIIDVLPAIDKSAKEEAGVFDGIAITDIEYLIKELSRLYDYDMDYASKLIDCLVFHETSNQGEDIFIRPLIKVSKEQVLMSTAFIGQLNYERAIESLLSKFNKNVSETGIEFQNEFRRTLSLGYKENSVASKYKEIPNFQVNTLELKYDAFDGREVEFDCVTTIGEFLVLTELKAVMTPYDYSGIRKRRKAIKEAIEQLKRRKESVIKDWDTFRSKVSINLPDQCYDEDHIIMVACTDIYDFTPTTVDDVYITDDSTYLKYFTAPYLESLSITDSIALIVSTPSLWKNGSPSASEFIEYLKNPITTSLFNDCYSKHYIPLPLSNMNDFTVAIPDYKLDKSPL